MNLPLPVLIGALLFAWTMWAVLFWGSIAIVERYNPYNKFGWALVWSTAELIASFAMGSIGIGGIGVLLVWLVFLMRLLLGRYELGMLHAIGVVIVTVVGPYFVADAFVAFVGTSETLFMLVLYGVPITIGLIWLWPRSAPVQPTNLPAARVERFRRKRGAAGAEAASPSPVPTPTPVAASPDAPAVAALPASPSPFRAAPVAAPPPPPPPIVPTAAPPPPALPIVASAAAGAPSAPSSDAPRDAGEPSFLR